MKRLLTVLVLLCGLTAAQADQLFNISLDSLQPVPPAAGPGTGTGTAFYDSTAGTLTLNVSFSGLIGVAIPQIGVFDGAAGATGPLIADFTFFVTGLGASSGSIAPVPVAFSPSFVTDMLAGGTYLVIPSTLFPSGEIRGQLVPTAVPEPATVGLVGLGILGLGFGLKRRRKA